LKSNSFFKVEGVQEDREKKQEVRKTERKPERINFFLKEKTRKEEGKKKGNKGKITQKWEMLHCLWMICELVVQYHTVEFAMKQNLKAVKAWKLLVLALELSR
jgi:hypothetical protein